MILISRYQAAHAWRDLKHRRWHDYSYAKPGDLLHPLEMWLRELTCLLLGHSYFEGENGEFATWTWKRGCRRCWSDRPA